MPGTILRKVQPNKAIDLADPHLLNRARTRRENQAKLLRLEARAVFLRRKAARLPLGSNGRDKATKQAIGLEAHARWLRDEVDQ